MRKVDKNLNLNDLISYNELQNKRNMHRQNARGNNRSGFAVSSEFNMNLVYNQGSLNKLKNTCLDENNARKQRKVLSIDKKLT